MSDRSAAAVSVYRCAAVAGSGACGHLVLGCHFHEQIVWMLAVVEWLALSPTSTSEPGPESAAGANTMSEPVTPTSGPAPERSATNFEIKFMEGMIDHHAMAVEMAEICVQKAVHKELRSLCNNVMTA